MKDDYTFSKFIREYSWMKLLTQFFVGTLALSLLAPSLSFAQPRHSDEVVAPTPVALSAADAAKELSDFRHSRLDGDFCIIFELTHRPRKGDDVVYNGAAWGTWNDQGPVTRFRLIEKPAKPATGQPAAAPATWEWLVQNGSSPHVWVFAPGATAAREVPSSEWRTPLFPGTVYTPFDLLMPFIFWSDSTYSGAGRVSDRGVDIFALKPPTAEQNSSLGSVRIYIDREFGDLVRTEQLDAKGKLVRQFDLGSITRVQGQWMIENCQLQDLVTHDYDKFDVKAVALKQKLDAAIFDPAQLGKQADLPPQSAWANL